MDARLRVARAAVVGALSMGLVGPAWALDAQLFAPAVDPAGYFSVYSSQTGHAGRYHLGVWYNAGEDPVATDVEVVDNPGFPPLVAPTFKEIEVKTVSFVHTIDLVASYTILDFLEVGVDLPVSTVDSEVPGVKEGIGLDDVMLLGKIRLLNNETMPLGLAIVPFVDFPTGNDRRLTANEEIDWGVRGVVDVIVDEDFSAALNGGVRVNDKPFDLEDDGDPDDYFYGAAFALRVVESGEAFGGAIQTLSILGEAFGQTIEESEFDGTFESPLEIAGGFRVGTPQGIAVTLGASGSAWRSVNGAQIRGIAGIDHVGLGGDFDGRHGWPRG